MTIELKAIALTTLLAAGILMTLHGLRAVWRARGFPQAGVPGASQAVLLVRALRLVLTGLAAVGIAFALTYDLSTLLVAALVIGGEELYETSMALALLEKIESNERTTTGPITD